MELMEGLTVLSTDTTAIEAPWLLFVVGCLAILLGIITIVLGIMALVDGEPAGMAFLILSLLMFILGVVSFHEVFKPEKTIYKVVIDESVSMVEFNKRYEILDQDGLIYEIVEKEK